MTHSPDHATIRRLTWFSTALGLCAVALGCTVLVGWWLGVDGLVEPIHGEGVTKANSAVAIVAIGLGIIAGQSWMHRSWARPVIEAAMFLAAAIAVATIVEYSFDLNLGIDQLLANDVAGADGAQDPGRPSMISAVSILALAMAGLLVRSRDQRAIAAAQCSALAVVGIASFAVLGYAYAGESASGIGPFSEMPILTAIGLALTAAGILFQRPGSGPVSLISGTGPGSVAARRLLPFSLLLFPAVGWLRLEGQRNDLFNIADGTVFYTAVTVVSFVGLTLFTAARLNRGDSRQRRAESDLLEHREKMQALIDNSPSVILMKSLDGRYMLVNKACAKLIGKDPAEIIGKTDHAFFPRAVGDAFEENYRECLVTMQPVTAEQKLQFEDRSRTFWNVRFPIVDRVGEVIGVGCVATDVSDRRRLERDLIENRNLMQAMLDSSAAAASLRDLDGRFLFINAAIEQMLGMPREQVVGRTIPEILPDLTDQTAENDAAVLSTKSPIEIVEELNLPAGTITIQGELFPVKDQDGKIYAIGSVSNDVTDSLKLAAELSESREMMQAILDNSKAVISLQDRDGKLLMMNRAGLESIRATEADVVGRPIAEVMPQSAEQIEANRSEVLRRGERIEIEEEIELPDGTHHILLDMFPISDAVGDLYAIGVIATDITDRKNIEIERTQLTDELAHEAERAQAANKELEAFAYTVSHDLRSPLRAIDGFARIVISEYGAQISEKGVHYLERVLEGTAEMSALIDDLLSFSRLSRQEMHAERVDLDALARQVLSELKAVEPDREINSSIASLPPCKGDPALLKVVLNNLISNAIKYTRTRKHATIEIGVMAMADLGSDTDLNKSAAGSGDRSPVYFVRDNGVGFDMRYVDKLFGVFQRLHRSDEFEGTGVGLATVHRIVDRHGGRIWAESELDEGSTFYFTIGEQNRSFE